MSNLLNGRFSSRFAKSYGKLLHDLLVTRESPQEAVDPAGPFECTKVSMWTGDAPLNTLMADLVTDSSDTLDAKKKAVDKCMEEQGWKGAQARIEFDLKNFAPTVVTDLPLPVSNGNKPMLVTCRRNSLRRGPAAIPFAGAATLLTCLESSIFFLVIAVEAILKEGVVLADLDGFLDTPTGEKMLMGPSAKIFEVKAGTTLYVPFGFVAEPVFLCTAAKNDKDAKQWGHFLSVNLLSVDFAKKCPSRVFQAVTVSIREHLSWQRGGMWADRESAWKAFSDSVGTP